MINRRQFAAGSLIVAVTAPGIAKAAWNGGQVAEASEVPGAALDIFIAIEPDGQITFVAPSAEIGQGIFTAQAQMIAEELECDFERVRIMGAPVDPRYNNPRLHQQVTVGSSSVRGFYMPLRIAGAQTRIRLVSAAAKTWNVALAECQAANGRVWHRASSRNLDYGALASAASREPIPPAEQIVLKPAAEFRLIGKSVPRVEVAEKVNGRAVYGIDVVRPGMKYAAVDNCPIVGGQLVSADPAPAMAVKGVHMVIPLPNAVAVLADNSWAAFKGLAALKPEWSGDRMLNSATMAQQLKAAARDDKPTFSESEGDVPLVLQQADSRIDMVFDLPFLAHATMEPINVTVDLKESGCDIWLGTQAPDRIRAATVKMTGLAPEKVRVWNHLSGGGFGRRGSTDFMPAAIMIAKKAGVPVKMIWSREQDMRASLLRPLWRHEVSMGLKAGRIAGVHHRIIGGSVVAQLAPQLLKFGPDVNAVEGARELIYKVDAHQLDYVRCDPALPITFWRSVGPSHNMFVLEGAVNEAAEKLGVDPVELRRTMLDDPRARKVLDVAAEKGGWGNKKAARVGRGVAVQKAFGSYLACVIEAFVSEEGDVEVRKLTVAAEAGQIINPDGFVSQIEGGAIYGLTAALWGEITVTDGEMDQTNFHSYRMMRINESPIMEVHIVPSGEKPEGAGEIGTSIVFPALAAAIHDATGVRLRSMPFDRHAALAGKATKGDVPDAPRSS